MSADLTVAYVGVRVERPASDESEGTEARTDALFEKARRARLKVWSGPKYDRDGEQVGSYSLIGTEVARMGLEGQLEFSVTEAELVELFASTRAKLLQMGIEESPRFLLQVDPDF